MNCILTNYTNDLLYPKTNHLKKSIDLIKDIDNNEISDNCHNIDGIIAHV